MTSEPDCPDTFTGPTAIAAVRVQCDDDNRVRYSVDTSGWTHDGYVFAQETGNADTPYAQWSDNHTIVSYDWDACQGEDHLERILDDVSHLADPLNDWVTNESTVFSCANHYGVGVMTYAFAVRDTSDVLADCLAFGNDVTGMVNDVYNRISDADFDLSICREGTGVEAR